MVNPYTRYLKLISVAELILWCYTDQFGPKTQIEILTLLKADSIAQQKHHLSIIFRVRNVYKMHAGILREILEQYEINAT